MKIINKTNYDTLSLKKLFTRCLQEDEKHEGRLPESQRDNLRIFVTNRHNATTVSGRAYVGGRTIKMKIPSQSVLARLNQTINDKVEAIAWIFIHELAHIRGYLHKAISDVPYQEMVKAWSNDYKITEKVLAIREKKDIKYIRYEHIVKTLNNKLKGLKRLQNQIKKLQTKKRYYEKKFIEKG